MLIDFYYISENINDPGLLRPGLISPGKWDAIFTFWSFAPSG